MSDLFHVGISGARGKMGRSVDLVLDARSDVMVAARFDWGETPDLSRCDVVIDFSTAEASMALAEACAATGGPAQRRYRIFIRTTVPDGANTVRAASKDGSPIDVGASLEKPNPSLGANSVRLKSWSLFSS